MVFLLEFHILHYKLCKNLTLFSEFDSTIKMSLTMKSTIFFHIPFFIFHFILIYKWYLLFWIDFFFVWNQVGHATKPSQFVKYIFFIWQIFHSCYLTYPQMINVVWRICLFFVSTRFSSVYSTSNPIVLPLNGREKKNGIHITNIPKYKSNLIFLQWYQRRMLYYCVFFSPHRQIKSIVSII